MNPMKDGVIVNEPNGMTNAQVALLAAAIVDAPYISRRDDPFKHVAKVADAFLAWLEEPR